MFPNNKNRVFNNNKNTYLGPTITPSNNSFFQHSSVKFKAPSQIFRTNTANNPISQSLISTIYGNSIVGQQRFAQSGVNQSKPYFPAHTTLANTNNKKPVISIFRSFLTKNQHAQSTNKNTASTKQTTTIDLATPSNIVSFTDRTAKNKTPNNNEAIPIPLHNTPVGQDNSDVTDKDLQSIIWSPEAKPLATPVLDADKDFPPLMSDEHDINTPASKELETISIAQTTELLTEELSETPPAAPTEGNNQSSSCQTDLNVESVLDATDNGAGNDKGNDEPSKNSWAQRFFAGIRNGLSSFVKIPGQLFGAIFNLFFFKRA